MDSNRVDVDNFDLLILKSLIEFEYLVKRLQGKTLLSYRQIPAEISVGICS